MPDLSSDVVADLTNRLQQYLAGKPEYNKIEYLTSGGSAAVYRVEHPSGSRAIKVFDPKFLVGPGGEAERQRLDLQKTLIGHECENLVQIYKVEEAEGTAIVEMDFTPWPQLRKKLHEVPDDKVENLIQQLVNVVQYLESKDIVHRDIKPENIHISEDFSRLLLLDLGVVRTLDLGDGVDASLTDQNHTRPFVATAQYSSPEYLFRLDEPSPKLWKGLNIYQVGAVLHDLIQKKPLFQSEISLGNRWLVAKAVLTKTPDFKDDNPERLIHLKILAHKCLTKELDLRIKSVEWSDFTPSDELSPIDKLKNILKKEEGNVFQNVESSGKKLEFQKKNYFLRLKEKVREELVSICGNKIPPIVTIPYGESVHCFRVEFNLQGKIAVISEITVEWGEGLYVKDACILYAAKIASEGDQSDLIDKELLIKSSLDEDDSIQVREVVNKISNSLANAINLLEVTIDHDALINKKI